MEDETLQQLVARVNGQSREFLNTAISKFEAVRRGEVTAPPDPNQEAPSALERKIGALPSPDEMTAHQRAIQEMIRRHHEAPESDSPVIAAFMKELEGQREAPPKPERILTPAERQNEWRREMEKVMGDANRRIIESLAKPALPARDRRDAADKDLQRLLQQPAYPDADADETILQTSGYRMVDLFHNDPDTDKKWVRASICELFIDPAEKATFVDLLRQYDRAQAELDAEK
jgi:hypothetical protein